MACCIKHRAVIHLFLAFARAAARLAAKAASDRFALSNCASLAFTFAFAPANSPVQETPRIIPEPHWMLAITDLGRRLSSRLLLA